MRNPVFFLVSNVNFQSSLLSIPYWLRQCQSERPQETSTNKATSHLADEITHRSVQIISEVKIILGRCAPDRYDFIIDELRQFTEVETQRCMKYRTNWYSF